MDSLLLAKQTDSQSPNNEDEDMKQQAQKFWAIVNDDAAATRDDLGKRPIKRLKLSQIRADHRAQPRAMVNESLVAEYAEQMEAGIKFPPLKLCFDGKTNWLAEGFHRLAAAKAAGLEEIEVEVYEGGLHLARYLAAHSNITHGLRRSAEDKRRAIIILLEDPVWRERSDRWIAQHCDVSPTTVGIVREQSNYPPGQSSSRRLGADGRVRDVSKIGKRKSSKAPAGSSSDQASDDAPEEPEPAAGQPDEEPLDPAQLVPLGQPLEVAALNKLSRLQGLPELDIQAVATAETDSARSSELLNTLERLIPWLSQLVEALGAQTKQLDEALGRQETAPPEEQPFKPVRDVPEQAGLSTLSPQEANDDLDALLLSEDV